jgi:Fe-Mn family superoxide dismutase
MKAAGAGAMMAAMGGGGGSAIAAPVETSLPPALGDAFADGKYVLPKLPYALDALQPQYDAKTLELHHDKHHAAYVAGANATLDKLAAARTSGDFAAVRALSRDLAFHGSGHVLHTLFWQSMAPGGSKGSAAFQQAINDNFGSNDVFRKQFSAAARDVEGSGWAVLALEPISGKLLVLQAEKHQDLTIWGAVPLLVCDVWEHAYYLQYQNRRPEWVEAFGKIMNLDFASRMFDYAQKCRR